MQSEQINKQAKKNTKKQKPNKTNNNEYYQQSPQKLVTIFVPFPNLLSVRVCKNFKYNF